MHISYENEPDSLYRGLPPRIAKVKAIDATARLLRPTQSSLANTAKKVLHGKAKERAEARKQEMRRRRLTRVAKNNGRLTIPKSPKFHTHSKKQPRVPQLTMTSRELQEIEAIRKQVRAMRKKTRQYHEAMTRPIQYQIGAVTADKSKFAMALRSSGGVGVPAVRRAKLTTPIGFDLEIDKRKRMSKRMSHVPTTTTHNEEAFHERTSNQRRRISHAT